MAEEEEVLQRLPQVTDDPFEPVQVLGKKSTVRIAEHEASSRVAPEVKRNPNDRSPAQLLPHGTRQARQVLEAAPILPIPAEAIAGALQLIPAYAGVRLVEEEAVAPVHGEVFRCKARLIPGPVSPDKNALNIGVAKRQNRFIAVEGGREFSQ